MRLFTTLICSILIFVSCKKKEKEVTNIILSQPAYEPQEINVSLWNEKQFQVINGNLVPFNGLTTLIMFDSLRNKML